MGLYKRGNSWIISYFASGRRKRETIGPSKRQAELVLAKRMDAVREGKFFDVKKGGSITFRELAQRYMDDYAVHHKALSSVRNDWSKLKRLDSEFGDLKLRAVDAEAINTYLAGRLAEGKSRATVNRDRALLSHIFTLAVGWRLAPSNPVRLVKALREDNGRTRYLTPAELARLVVECCGWLRPIVLTAAHTGMRKEEVLGLRRDQVNARERTIHLTRTKNGHSRVVPINDQLWEALFTLPRRLHSPYVFAKENGKRYHADGLKRAFSKALKLAEIEDFRFHDLRATAASNLAMAGVDLFTIGQILGHRTPSMTQRYAHLAHSHLSEAVQKLGTALEAGANAEAGEATVGA